MLLLVEVPPTDPPYVVVNNTTTKAATPTPKVTTSKTSEEQTTLKEEVTTEADIDKGQLGCEKQKVGELSWPPTRAGITRRVKCQQGQVGKQAVKD